MMDDETLDAAHDLFLATKETARDEANRLTGKMGCDLVAEVRRLRAHFEVLRSELEAARNHLENKGGQQAGGPPMLAMCPPSTRTYLERLCRAALGGMP
jgi:hypothetical protein